MMKITIIGICVLSIIFLMFLLLKNRSTEMSEDGPVESQNFNLPSKEIIDESKILAPVLSEIISKIQNSIRPNMTTKELDTIAKKIIEETGFKVAMLGYRGYPAATCISLNEQILHSIPSSQKISEGDLVKIQTAIRGKTAFANQGWTFMVGSVSDEKEKLYQKGLEALKKAISELKSGLPVGNIGAIIQTSIEGAGYSVIREFVGYSMGANMHQAPQIPCYGENGRGPKIKSGMILNIHVIAAMGDSTLYISEDSWGAITSDHQPSVLFSAMVLIEPYGNSLLSKLMD